MFANALRHVIDNNLTTRKEVQRITGRGAATIHRWLKGQSEPSYADVRKLVRGFHSVEAQRTFASILTGDLPVQLNWLDDDQPDVPMTLEQRERSGQEAIDRSLMALECISQVLTEEHNAMRRRALTTDACHRIVTLADDAIRYLTFARSTALILLATRKKARELQGMPDCD